MSLVAHWSSCPGRSSHTALSTASNCPPIPLALLCRTWMQAVHCCRRCTYTDFASMCVSEHCYDDPAAWHSKPCTSPSSSHLCSFSTSPCGPGRTPSKPMFCGRRHTPPWRCRLWAGLLSRHVLCPVYLMQHLESTLLYFTLLYSGSDLIVS